MPTFFDVLQMNRHLRCFGEIEYSVNIVTQWMDWEVEHWKEKFTTYHHGKMTVLSGLCPSPVSCSNGGVQDVNNCTKCRCPMGWSGDNCDQRVIFVDWSSLFPLNYAAAQHHHSQRNCNTTSVQASSGKQECGHESSLSRDVLPFQGLANWIFKSNWKNGLHNCFIPMKSCKHTFPHGFFSDMKFDDTFTTSRSVTKKYHFGKNKQFNKDRPVTFQAPPDKRVEFTPKVLGTQWTNSCETMGIEVNKIN